MTSDLGGPEMRPERTAAIERMLVENIRNEPRTRAVWGRRRALAWTGIGIGFIAAATTAGALLLGSQEVSDTEIVHCASRAEVTANGELPGSAATITADSSRPGRVADALGLCTEMWSSGALEPGFDPLRADNPPGNVPADLTVCVMGDGSAAVVPGRAGVCETLGLAPLID